MREREREEKLDTRREESRGTEDELESKQWKSSVSSSFHFIDRALS